jgi:hypothetical protein
MSRSKRDPLRALSKTFPSPAEAGKLVRTMHGRDDRSVALVFAALIEALLEKLIAKKFTHMTPQLEGRLFKNRGPLSDFDSKILIAEALHVTPDIDFVVPLINSIKAIRNAFAHSMVDSTFQTKEISDELNTYLLPFALKGQNAHKRHSDVKGTELEDTLTNKAAFCLASFMICHHLDDTLYEITGAYLFDYGNTLP